MSFPLGFCITSIAGENKNNFGLITAPDGMKAAAVFTMNSQAAHPVEFSREKILNPSHRVIFVNKGIANAATGKLGRKRLGELIEKLSYELGIKDDEILVASTGVIGRQLEYNDSEIEALTAKKDEIDPYGFARAIMTTDTCSKIISDSVLIEGKEIKMTGIVKGSGMISPDMATMLGFILTDTVIEKEALESALKKAVDVTFNLLSVDGETSTNDTVFLSASGSAGNTMIKSDMESYDSFYDLLERVCVSLVEKIARDGEGATKLVKISIRGVSDTSLARKAVKAISVSPLCKTAFYGASPNWGRLVSAMGAARIPFDIDRFYLDVNGIVWIKDGVPVEENQAKIKGILETKEYEINMDLKSGEGEATGYTCDFSPEYVGINANYLS